MIPAWHKLASAFYARVFRDPLLRPLFPGKSPHCAVEELAAFLEQYYGGSGEETQRRWWLSLRESHLRFKIGPAERAAWMENMVAALDDAGIREPLLSDLRILFGRSSAYLVNTEAMPEVDAPGDSCWDSQVALDQAVAAIRVGDAERAIALVESSVRNRSVLVGLLALMMRTRHDSLTSYVRKRLDSDPTLIGERNAGRNILHDAAAQGNGTMVEFLLKLGADVEAKTAGGHTPLYCLSNEFHGEDGGGIVHALLQRGAKVNACDGKSRATPLHMAARRGSHQIAEALIEHGADINARDSKGDTPLRRAMNCKKPTVVALLRQHGAST